MEQQSQRKTELLDTLYRLEAQRDNEHQDFWLLQYQKLLDTHHAEISFKTTTIDPLLGYNFLVNGVVHCIPFLSKLWQSEKYSIDNITDSDLIEAGIKKPADREKILRSICDFLKVEQSQVKEAITQPTDEPKAGPTAPHSDQPMSNVRESVSDLESECVICMEESVIILIFSWVFTLFLSSVYLFIFQCKIIFLPCGHLCCCLNCHTSVENCPMCRASIERRIKVIQA